MFIRAAIEILFQLGFLSLFFANVLGEIFSDKTVRMNKSNESLTGRDTFFLFKIQQENNRAEEVFSRAFSLRFDSYGGGRRKCVEAWCEWVGERGLE